MVSSVFRYSIEDGFIFIRYFFMVVFNVFGILVDVDLEDMIVCIFVDRGGGIIYIFL